MTSLWWFSLQALHFQFCVPSCRSDSWINWFAENRVRIKGMISWRFYSLSRNSQQFVEPPEGTLAITTSCHLSLYRNRSVQFSPVQSSLVQSSLVQYITVQSSPVQSSPIQSSPVQYSTVQSSTVQSSPIQSSPHNFNLTLPSHLRLDLPNLIFPPRHPSRLPVSISLLPCTCHMPYPSHCLLHVTKLTIVAKKYKRWSSPTM